MPKLNWNGTDSFTYKANDGLLDSGTVAVTITVIAVNDAPVAFDDSYNMDEDTTLTIDVVANDTDVEDDTLTPVLADSPLKGNVVLNDDHTFTYTPNPNEYGSDSFTYRANDGTVDSDNTATVSIEIADVLDFIPTSGMCLIYPDPDPLSTCNPPRPAPIVEDPPGFPNTTQFNFQNGEHDFAVIFPEGTHAESGTEIFISTEYTTTASPVARITVDNVQLPTDQFGNIIPKAIIIPRPDTGNNTNRLCIKDYPDANYMGTTSLCSPGPHTDLGGNIDGVVGFIDLSTVTSPYVLDNALGYSWTLTFDADSVMITNLLNSVVEFIPDADGDTVSDDADECPLVFGTAAFHGCPAAVDVYFERASTQAGIADANVSVFSLDEGSCASNIGNGASHYGEILASCTPELIGQTDAAGNVRLGLDLGKRLLLATDPLTGLIDGADLGFDGAIIGNVKAGDLVSKKLKI